MELGIVMIVGNSLLKEIVKNDEELKRIRRKSFYYSIIVTLLILLGFWIITLK